MHAIVVPLSSVSPAAHLDDDTPRSPGVCLSCADHPATGSTADLERAAAVRIVAMAAVADVDKEASAMLFGLMIRASSHDDRAVRAYAKAACRPAGGRG